ncbi:MAG: FUSC family protein [Actinobacteria bacterium]|nr:FUSC family protein [Actinomycetota bacterium]
MTFGATLARKIVRVERENLQIIRSLRTAGVATVLPLIAWMAGIPDAMVPLGVGALFVGIAESNIHPEHRGRIMLWATAWLTALSALGFLVAESAVLVVIASVLVAAATGWAGVAGPRPTLIGVLSLVLFTITVGLPESVELEVSFVAMVGLGGLVQTALFAVTNVARRNRVGPAPEREPTTVWFRVTHPGAQRPTFIRHAVSMGVAIGIATAISQFVDVPHQYWIPMTVAWIFKSDQNATVVRVVERMVGTLLAIGIAFLWGVFVPAPDVALFAAVAVGAYLLLAFLTSNYSIATFGVTTFVLALFAIAGDLYEETVVFRLEATLGAGLIVVVVVFMMKIWGRKI